MFGAAADLALSITYKKPLTVLGFLRKGAISLIAFAYSVYTIYGSGAEYVMYGFLLILIGLPLFTYVKLSNQEF